MIKLVLLSALFSFPTVLSAKCIVKYERTACKGQEVVSYKKCGGSKTCEKKKRAKNADQCRKAAAKSCSNSRLDITKSKVITATWKGKELLTKDGKKDFCDPKSPEFNKCPEDK